MNFCNCNCSKINVHILTSFLSLDNVNIQASSRLKCEITHFLIRENLKKFKSKYTKYSHFVCHKKKTFQIVFVLYLHINFHGVNRYTKVELVAQFAVPLDSLLFICAGVINCVPFSHLALAYSAILVAY